MITVDEGDHFAGGVGTPQPRRRRCLRPPTAPTLAPARRTRSARSTSNINRPAHRPASRRTTSTSTTRPRSTSTGSPAATDPTARKLEQRRRRASTSLDPYVRNAAASRRRSTMTQHRRPGRAEALHMVNADPNRTPTFMMFGNPTSSSRRLEPVRTGRRRAASTRASPGTTATSRTRSATPGSGLSGPASRTTASTRRPGPTTRTCGRRSSS